MANNYVLFIESRIKQEGKTIHTVCMPAASFLATDDKDAGVKARYLTRAYQEAARAAGNAVGKAMLQKVDYHLAYVPTDETIVWKPCK